MSYSSYREDFLRGVSLWSLNGNRMRDMPCHHEFHHHRRDFVWKHSLFHHMPLLLGCLNIRARERESFGMMTLADFVEWSWKKKPEDCFKHDLKKTSIEKKKKVGISYAGIQFEDSLLSSVHQTMVIKSSFSFSTSPRQIPNPHMLGSASLIIEIHINFCMSCPQQQNNCKIGIVVEARLS